MFLGGCLGGDHDQAEEEDEVPPDKDADQRHLGLTGDPLVGAWVEFSEKMNTFLGLAAFQVSMIF